MIMPTPAPVRTLRPTFVTSHNVQCLAYAEGYLYARFNSGPAYRYAQVPEQLYRDLLLAESVGHLFDQQVIKGRFRYERLKEDPFLPAPVSPSST